MVAGHDMHTDVNLDDVTGLDGSLYTNCHGRYLQSVRNVIRPGFSGGSRVWKDESHDQECHTRETDDSSV